MRAVTLAFLSEAYLAGFYIMFITWSKRLARQGRLLTQELKALPHTERLLP